MSGKKGMKPRTLNPRSARGRMWQVMRRRLVFTVDDIVVPLEGVKLTNVERFILHLRIHGFIRIDRWSGTPGQRGSRKIYRLVRNPGPDQPAKCPACGRSLTARKCEVAHDES